MATTNNDQTTVNADDNTPTATVAANTDQTVSSTTNDENPKSTETKVVDEPTNNPPPSIETVSVDPPILTNTTPVNVAKSLELPSIDTVGAANEPSVAFQISSEEATLNEDATTTTTTPKVVNDTVVITSPTTAEPQTPKQPSTTGRNVGAEIVAVVRKSYKLFIVLGIILIISLLELSIGWNYAEQCPVNWRIPHYLVVAGTIGIVIVAIVTIQTFLQVQAASQKNNSSIVVICGTLSLLVVLTFLFLFSIGWFIAGCIWVFRAWNKVQHEKPKQSNYCHPTLYRFTFWLLLITICYILFLAYRVFRRGRQAAANLKKGSPKPIPTAEV